MTIADELCHRLNCVIDEMILYEMEKPRTTEWSRNSSFDLRLWPYRLSEIARDYRSISDPDSLEAGRILETVFTTRKDEVEHTEMEDIVRADILLHLSQMRKTLDFDSRIREIEGRKKRQSRN